MGLLLNVDLETSLGPTQEAYVSIEGIRANRASGKIMFTTTTWIDREAASNFYKDYYEDGGNNAVGMIASKVLYFKNTDGQGVELNIPNFYEIPMGTIQTIEKPVYGYKEISKEVPYISFDEEGNELTLYKTVTDKEKVQVGTEKIKRTVLDKSIMDNLASYCYKHLTEKMKDLFSSEKIETV